jgi:hypothetical protein
MLKRTLIAIAVVALLATSAAQALGPDPHTGKMDKNQGIKVDKMNMNIYWPFEYKALDLCAIPVFMDVGVMVQVEKCNERKIVLKQVECGDIGKNTQGDWPCYKDCEDLKVRANINVKLGLTKAANDSGVLDKWTAYFKDGKDTVDGLAGWTTVTVCVDAWRARLYEAAPGDKIRVGTVTVTVKPNV